MRRVRYRTFDGVHWGQIEGGVVHESTGIQGRPTGVTVPLEDVALLPPCEPRNIVCVGKNYAAHVAEMGGDASDRPSEPGLFLKPLASLAGPGDPIPYPSWTNELHYEGELAVVIGERLHRATPEAALDAVAGYTCAIDVTARDAQRDDLQWARAKGADGFCPVGPWLETDLDPAHARVRTFLNGELRQDGRTSDLIFPVAEILAHVSSFLTLQPGDLVLTGTPDGVGAMRVGDAVAVDVTGVGRLEATVEAA